MTENAVPRLSKVPFIIGDVLLLIAATWLFWRSPDALDVWKSLAVVAAVGLGAWLAIMPFILEFRAQIKATETTQLATATEQLGHLDEIARQIAGASLEWQRLHQGATETVAAADQIAEKMVAESRNFGEVLARINDVEKNHLRLEIDKLRRAEAEWLQVLVRTFDQIYALYQAAIHSDNRNVAEQITQFQNTCREVARRIGFMPIVPASGAPFDEKHHRLLDGQAPESNATLGEIVAPGYTFQGQLLRLPVVTLAPAAASPTAAEPPQPEKPAEADPQLTFDEPS